MRSDRNAMESFEGQISADTPIPGRGLLLLVVLIGGAVAAKVWGDGPTRIDVFRSIVLNVGAGVLVVVTLLNARNAASSTSDRVFLRLAISLR
jgi:hypothetical protein